MKSRIAFAAWSVLALASVASARPIFHFDFTLDGLQETPPNGSPGFGHALVDLDTTAHMLFWDITYGSLVAPVTAAHFHGYAPPGTAAGVIIPIPLGLPLIGSAPTTAAFESGMLAGLTYVNIHTTAFPGGEIRGQVVPAPASALLLGAGGLLAIRRRR